MPSVLITCPVFTPRDASPVERLEAGGCTVRHAPEGAMANQAELAELLQGHDAVIAAGETYSHDVMTRAPSLKHIARWGVGFDQVDIPAATELGVLVTTTQGANDWAVADHAFGLILALAHQIVENDEEVRRGVWGRRIGVDVWRKTLGIVGLGRIGKGVARRARGFEMTVLAAEPEPDMPFVQEHGVELAPIEDVLRRADFVTLHLPASAETRHYMNQERLALMKPTAYLVNTARGSLVDEDALYGALVEGRIAGAGLDVREQEPAADTRFDDIRNVILTSHIAGVTHESMAAMARMAVDSVLEALAGQPPGGLLNPEAWERRRR